MPFSFTFFTFFCLNNNNPIGRTYPPNRGCCRIFQKSNRFNITGIYILHFHIRGETVNNQYLGGDASLACSAETQTQIDHQVVALVKKEHAKAVGILTENRAKLDELAKYLYEKETITGDEFRA